MLRFFSDSATSPAIAALAKSEKLTVFVGAGASREVGLPTWNELLARLWSRAAIANEWSDVENDVFPRLDIFGSLGAAERIQCSLSTTDLTAAIREALYEVKGVDGLVQTRDPAEFQPGPISDEIARLRKEFGDGLTLATTNYDQLLLKALRENGMADARSYCLGSKKCGVVHLHGVVGFEDPEDGDNVVVLTERDYLAPTNSGWREDFLREHLKHACLFVGASLTDLNFLSPLHQGSIPNAPRVVLLTRPTSSLSRTEAVLEEIERKRWDALGVTALFADEYSDVAQFIHEVRLHRSGSSVPLPDRWSELVEQLQTGLLSTEPATYRSNQKNLSEGLRAVIDAMRTEFTLGDEAISIGVCALLPATGGDVRPVNWVSSDREMVDPMTIDPLVLDRSSPWTAVKAICAGVTRVESKSNYASRWHYLWAEPIFSSSPMRLPLGAVVLSTMADEASTRLPVPGTADASSTAKVSQILQDVGRQLFEPGN